jgi:Spy/CpxP family protein refolding chaperone
MKCPYCGKQIDISKQMAKWGAKGGSKSRRILTPEQARKMVKAREAKRRQRGKENE